MGRKVHKRWITAASLQMYRPRQHFLPSQHILQSVYVDKRNDTQDSNTCISRLQNNQLLCRDDRCSELERDLGGLGKSFSAWSTVGASYAQVFHAGTGESASGQLVSAGGRVLGLTSKGDTILAAQDRAYQVRCCRCCLWCQSFKTVVYGHLNVKCSPLVTCTTCCRK